MWYKNRLAAFDIETTGIDFSSDEVVTAAVSLVGGGLPAEDHDWVVNPAVPISEESEELHGISKEFAESNGVLPEVGLEEIIATLADTMNSGIPVVVFNAAFDITMIENQASRYGIRPLTERVEADRFIVIDPFIIDRAAVPKRPGRRTLTSLCRHYSVPFEGVQAHSANEDALAAARLAWRMGDVFKALGALELPELYARQKEWAQTQSESLREYFESIGADKEVLDGWPIFHLPK